MVPRCPSHLDIVERLHPSYNKQVSEALAEALAIPDDAPPMTAAEFAVWLTSL